MANRPFFIKPSILISIGLTAAIGAWLYSGVDQNVQANTSDQVTASEEAIASSDVETELPSYKTSVRFIESQAQDHRSTLSITAQTKYDRKAVVRAETYGQVTKLDMEETYPTKKGALLAQLEIEDRGAHIKRAKALLKQREIQFEAATKLAQKGFNSKIKKSEAEANLESAKADLRVAEINYSNTSLKSPFSGIIQEQHVEIGDYVQKGDPIATIVDMNPIYVVAYVSEKEIKSIKSGALASATLVTGEKLEGIVSHISPVALETTRSFKVEVEVANDAGTILSGLTASVNLPLGHGRAHILSPALLTLNDEGQVGVKYVDDKNIVHFNQVTVIEDTENGVWVGGLPENVRIIAVGQEFVSVGSEVNATPLAIANVASNS